jgi:hypothetical protein
MEKFARWIAGLCLELVCATVVFAIVVAMLFVPFGILFALVTKELSGLYMIPCLGGILGSLMGIGQVIIDRFSDGKSDPHEESRPTWGLLADFYLGAFSPSWMKVLEAIGWVANKDFSEQEPGRWKRGLIAAVACALIPPFLFGCVALTSPMPPAPGLFPALLILTLAFGLGGGIAGALSDSFAPRSRDLSRLDGGPRPRRPTSRQGHIDRGGDGVTSEAPSPEVDHGVPEVVSRVMEAERKGWWVDKLELVDQTDDQLAVISPRADASDDELKSMGRALKQWKDTHGYARHIWGLDDLLLGRCPRTPPVYLMVPFPIDDLHQQYEPVALVFVAGGTNHEEAFESLTRAMDEHRGRLAWLSDPEAYSYWQR